MSFDIDRAVQEGVRRAGEDLANLWPSELESLAVARVENGPYLIGLQGHQTPLLAVETIPDGEDLKLQVSFFENAVPDPSAVNPLPGISQDQLHRIIVCVIAGLVDQEQKNEFVKQWANENQPELPDGFPYGVFSATFNNAEVSMGFHRAEGDSTLMRATLGLEGGRPTVLGPDDVLALESFPQLPDLSDIQIYQLMDLMGSWVVKAQEAVIRIQNGDQGNG